MAACPPPAAQVSGASWGHLGAPAAAIDPCGHVAWQAGSRRWGAGGSPGLAAPRGPSAPIGAVQGWVCYHSALAHVHAHTVGVCTHTAARLCTDVCAQAWAAGRLCTPTPCSSAVLVCACMHHHLAAAHLCMHTHPQTPCSNAVLVRAHTWTHTQPHCSTAVFVRAHTNTLQRCTCARTHTEPPCSGAVLVQAHTDTLQWCCTCACTQRHLAVMLYLCTHMQTHTDPQCSAVLVHAHPPLAVMLYLCTHTHTLCSRAVHMNPSCSGAVRVCTHPAARLYMCTHTLQ